MDLICRPMNRWPREQTPEHLRKSRPFKTSFERSRRKLMAELRHLKATLVVLETAFSESDISLTTGMPRGDRNPGFPGVIVAADTKHGALKWLCDDCRNWCDNVHAIALTLERLRLADRYGVTGKGEQYAGWKMLPGPITAPAATSALMTMEGAARFVAGIVGSAIATADQLVRDKQKWKAAYRAAADRLHPDKGGAMEEWKRLQEAAGLLDNLHERR